MELSILPRTDQDCYVASSPTFVRVTLSQATGTAPLTVSSTTAVANLNADLLDGNHAAAFLGASATAVDSDKLDGHHYSDITTYVSGAVGSAVASMVPYSGAVNPVNLGAQALTTTGTVTGGHVKDTSLTAGRVAVVGTGGQLADSAGATYADGGLTLANSGAEGQAYVSLGNATAGMGGKLLSTPAAVGFYLGDHDLNTLMGVGPSGLEIGYGEAGRDYSITFIGEDTQGILKWMEDEDRFQFSDDVFMQAGENLIFHTTGGSKIGTASNQKFSFWGVATVTQPATVTAPSGGATVDAEARTAIGTIISRLQTLGLIGT